jgi:hypothetical protein
VDKRSARRLANYFPARWITTLAASQFNLLEIFIRMAISALLSLIDPNSRLWNAREWVGAPKDNLLLIGGKLVVKIAGDRAAIT